MEGKNMSLAYDYGHAFEWETRFDMGHYTRMMEANFHYAFFICVVYVVSIFAIQSAMRHRRPFVLRRELAAWNTALATFSLWAFYRMWPELRHSWGNSPTYSFCNNSFAQGVTGLYAFLFAISKVFELGDTFFVVLRKQNLIFLHWYHHVTVLLYTWLAYFSHTASGRWFITVNLAVHSFMYTYYALKALRLVPMPKAVPFCITMCQLAQMVMGVVANVHNLYVKKSGGECHQTWNNLYLALAMYASYFLLFVQFFAANYFGGGKFANKTTSANGELNGETVGRRKAAKID